MNAGTPRAERFTRAFRLRLKHEFQRVYESRHRRESGPLLVYGQPNELGHPRIGLSVGRKVGNAVVRTRIKRQLRECFRRVKADFTEAFDFVVVVRPHGKMDHAEYRRHLESAMRKVVGEWSDQDKHT
jgi:ribonuclease P protein component